MNGEFTGHLAFLLEGKKKNGKRIFLLLLLF